MRLLTIVLVTIIPIAASAGGPRWVAGSSYFDPAALGKPIVWRAGVVSYYTDQGDLSPDMTQAQANDMVASAAAMWSSVPTAALSIVAAGSLAEDVNGANIAAPSGVPTAPSDIVTAATQIPLAIVYDYDGAVIDALLGPGASDPIACLGDGVTLRVDGFSTDATINHALMIVNGRCATTARLPLMQYLITRAFGRVLGLDWSQANDGIFTTAHNPGAQLGWPLMHPIERLCTSASGNCMPGPLSLRPDDIAALNRLYPVTPSNVASFPGKVLTAASTISIQGVLHFRSGQGMQGVNVVAQPLLPGTNTPDPRYTATAVSGAFFRGAAANPINGDLDPQGNPLDRYGSSDPALEGAFDLTGILLPPGATQADYQLGFEAIDPNDTGINSVGPYTLGQVKPSGTMPLVVVRGLQAGSSTVEDIAVKDANQNLGLDADGQEDQPASQPGNGEWLAKLDGYGHSNWYRWHIRAGRLFTVETVALDEQGRASADKARPVLGIWDGVNAPGLQPANPIVKTIQPFDSSQVGLTSMLVTTFTDSDVRLGVADQRGDGRPDYLYRGRVLYADSVTPQRVPIAGAPVTIRGTGFRPQNVVTVNGMVAAITSLTSTEISAILPPAPPGLNGSPLTGSLDLTVTDPATQGVATITAGVSYDAGDTDSLGIMTAPSNAVPLDVPIPFTVKTLAADGATPAGLLVVTYSLTSGTALLGCGQPTCTVVSSGDGLATLSVTATSTAIAVITASLANGANVQAHFTGGLAPRIAALTPTLYLAQGATFVWAPSALVLTNGSPAAGQTVNWTSTSPAITLSAPSTTSDAQGHSTAPLSVGPLPPATTVQVKACLSSGPPNCAVFTISSVNPAIAGLVPVTGTDQSISSSDTPAPAVLRVADSAGHPMAAGVVNFYETLTEWQPPCPLHGRCPAAPVIAAQTAQSISTADGLVSLTLLTRPGQATTLNVIAVTGGDTTLNFQISQHP